MVDGHLGQLPAVLPLPDDVSGDQVLPRGQLFRKDDDKGNQAISPAVLQSALNLCLDPAYLRDHQGCLHPGRVSPVVTDFNKALKLFSSACLDADDNTP
jgi:hypothetical protein